MARKQDENLKPFNKQSVSRARECGSKGGKKSGETRRQKADLRKAAQAVLTGTYTDKNGNQVTGEELVIKGIIANLAKPNSRNWAKSLDVLMDLTDSKKSEDEKQRLKAETELTLAKAQLMRGGDDESLSKLDEILRGLQEKAIDAGAEPKTE